MLRRLLQNLVSNAIKYTPRGRVLVGCRRRAGQCVVEVWDTGLGVPAAKQKTIFEEFQRLDQGARVARGLGLGLSIVERLARVLGHSIALVSTPGRGSMFSVAAPLGDASEVTRREERRQAGSRRIDEPLNGLVVLAMDNEPRVLDGLRVLLEKWGCEVIGASGLAESKAALQRESVRPDVIVADYHLDDGDGIQAIVALRESGRNDTPAILVTADRSPEVREKAMEAGAAVLNKPLRPAALRALLMRCKTARLAAE